MELQSVRSVSDHEIIWSALERLWLIVSRTPDLEVCLGDGFTGLDVEDLEVQGQGHTILVLDNVLADKFTSNVYNMLVGTHVSEMSGG